MKSYGRLIPVVLLCVFLSSSAIAVADKSEFSFVGKVTAPGIYQLELSISSAPDTMSFLVFAQPQQDLLFAVIDPDAEAQLIEQIEKMAPIGIVFAELQDGVVKAEIPWIPVHDNQFAFETARLQRGSTIIETIAEVSSNNPEWIEFIMETDQTGCMTMGVPAQAGLSGDQPAIHAYTQSAVMAAWDSSNAVICFVREKVHRLKVGRYRNWDRVNLGSLG